MIRPSRRFLALACPLAFLSPGDAASGEPEWGTVAVPLRTVNLNPFHLLYGLPASFGARVLPPGSSETVVSMDIASHLAEARSGEERVLIDGETYRYATALRHGFRDGWEYLFEVSAVAHGGGVFDGFIEDWHEFFGLPRGGRDRTPRDRLAVFYADGGGTRADIGRDVFSLGDVSLGAGYRVPLPNDGLALRASVKLPTGDEDSLDGSGGWSASLWAETSGALPWSLASRSWLYAATAGVLAAEAPKALPGRRFIGFGRFGVTWRPLARLTLTAQVDAHSPPYVLSGAHVRRRSAYQLIDFIQTTGVNIGR